MRPDDDGARRIAERMDEIPLPDGLEDRVAQAARATVRAGGAGAGARRRRRRRIGILATAALAVGIAGSAAGYWIATRDDDVNAIPAGPGARAAITESAILARLPWLTQTSGSPTLAETPAAPSLAFPPGTTYPVALDRLLRAVVERGELPRGTDLRPALPAGVVWAPGAAGTAPRLDLRAAFGYRIGDGAVLAPSVRLPPDATAAEARELGQALTRLRADGGPLPAHVRVDAQGLAPCQVLLPGERNATCRVAPPATD
ncbi:MAG TPA: hypothetical protein PKD59_02050 [Miltoncostaeaceae bacterium]|nr:hypothetical protein [Miltoncostaeaceae bacterium]